MVREYGEGVRMRETQGRPVGAENPPSGGASIASGYTPAAFAGAMPRHPLPLKGRNAEKGKAEEPLIQPYFAL